MSKLCPVCKRPSVPPSGPKDSPILIVGEFPGDSELEWGRPFVGYTGKILKQELARLGMDIKQYRLANLWIHPYKKDNKIIDKDHYDECEAFSLKIVMREAQNRQGILLLGSDCAIKFIRHHVMEISGLRVENESDLIKAPVIICSPNPASVLKENGVVGELRFALKQFAEAIEKLEEVEDVYSTH